MYELLQKISLHTLLYIHLLTCHITIDDRQLQSNVIGYATKILHMCK